MVPNLKSKFFGKKVMLETGEFYTNIYLGNFNGGLATVPAHDLASAVIKYEN